MEPWDKVRDRRTALALFLFIWMVFVATAQHTVNQMNDTRAATQSSWSLGVRGTLALPEEWRGEIDWETEGVDGRLYTDRFPGPVLWAAPFHAVGEALFPRGTPGHPHLLNYSPSAFAGATASALGVLVSFLLHRRLANRRLAVFGTLVLALGTGVWSVASAALWTHALTHLTLALGLLAAADGRNARSGLAFAMAIISRPQVAVVPAVVGIWRSAISRTIRPTAVIGFVSALGAVAMAVYSQTFFGTWLPVAGYSTSKVTAVASQGDLSLLIVRIAGTLGDPQRGVLLFTPVLLVLLPVLRHGWRASPWWVRSGAIAGTVYMLVQLRANGHTGGASFFGSRLTIETLVLASPLLLRTWQAYAGRDPFLRRAGIALIGVGFVLHTLGATVLSYPHMDDVGQWEQNIREICDQEPPPRGC